jgi:hypothetical protein
MVISIMSHFWKAAIIKLKWLCKIRETVQVVAPQVSCVPDNVILSKTEKGNMHACGIFNENTLLLFGAIDLGQLCCKYL